MSIREEYFLKEAMQEETYILKESASEEPIYKDDLQLKITNRMEPVAEEAL